MVLEKYFPKFLLRKRKLSDKDYQFCTDLEHILGYQIHNVNLYREAFSLKNNGNASAKNYERLEFLGDSVLGSIISCYLYDNYPDYNEGLLTQLKSKIVNRQNLNKIGAELNLTQFILCENKSANHLGQNICGNLFEALVGAIYLDVDYDHCKKIVLERLLLPSEINKLENKIVSYKGLLLEWSQKKKTNIRYETCEEGQNNKAVLFRCNVWLGDEKIANATETSKKKAEEKAATRAFYYLNKKEDILGSQKPI